MKQQSDHSQYNTEVEVMHRVEYVPALMRRNLELMLRLFDMFQFSWFDAMRIDISAVSAFFFARGMEVVIAQRMI